MLKLLHAWANMHLHQDPILAMEEEEKERKPARVGGEESERKALMVRGSLRKEEIFFLVDFHGHGRPWSLGAAAFRGERWEKSVREWRVKRNDQRRREWPAKLHIKRENGGCLLF